MGKTELMRVGIWPSAKGPFGLCEVLLLCSGGELLRLIDAEVIYLLASFWQRLSLLQSEQHVWLP